ncbi:MAG: ATP-binding protein [Longimicrobiales bacterium]
MTFRARLLLAGLVIAWLPLAGLGWVIRSVGSERLTDARTREMVQRSRAVQATWTEALDRLDRSLLLLDSTLSDDNTLRASLRSLPVVDPVLQSTTEGFSRAADLDVLYVLGEGGLILAASHFPAEVGRTSAALQKLVVDGVEADRPQAWIGAVPFAAGGRRMVTRGRATMIGGTPLLLVAGMDPSRLPGIEGEAGASDVSDVSDVALLVVPSQTDPPEWSQSVGLATGLSTPELFRPDGYEVVGLAEEGVSDGNASGQNASPSSVVFAWRDTVLPGMLASFDRALLLSLVGAALLTAIFSQLFAAALVRPVDRIAAVARKVHMGGLDASFGKGGGAEFDRLTRFLNGMMTRLRDGVSQVKEAERRATVGELARQVNHDVRNGLVPIRNVVTHLGEAHEDGAAALATAFEQRGPTLERSLSYLGELADQYRTVASHGSKAVTDLNEVVASVVAGAAGARDGVRLVHHAAAAPVPVQIDPVSLRRVVDNIVSNAVGAMADAGSHRNTGGTVELAVTNTETQVELTVSDDGPGIPEDALARIFEPFYSTREGGTGLGLAIVRRLVSDVGGRVQVDSEVGRGTTVNVSFRAVEAAGDSDS